MLNGAWRTTRRVFSPKRHFREICESCCAYGVSFQPRRWPPSRNQIADATTTLTSPICAPRGDLTKIAWKGFQV